MDSNNNSLKAMESEIKNNSKNLEQMSLKKRLSTEISDDTDTKEELSRKHKIKVQRFDELLKGVLNETYEDVRSISDSINSTTSNRPTLNRTTSHSQNVKNALVETNTFRARTLSLDQNKLSQPYPQQFRRRIPTVGSTSIHATIKRTTTSEKVINILKHALECTTKTCTVGQNTPQSSVSKHFEPAAAEPNKSSPNANLVCCISMKRLINHTNTCQLATSNCMKCSKMDALCRFHAQTCVNYNCLSKFCRKYQQAAIERELRSFEEK